MLFCIAAFTKEVVTRLLLELYKMKLPKLKKIANIWELTHLTSGSKKKVQGEFENILRHNENTAYQNYGMQQTQH